MEFTNAVEMRKLTNNAKEGALNSSEEKLLKSTIDLMRTAADAGKSNLMINLRPTKIQEALAKLGYTVIPKGDSMIVSWEPTKSEVVE
jgi:hypothetical protein